MKRVVILVMMFLVAGFAGDGFAQGVQTGTMRGTVKDQQGLPIPGVTVTVTSPALQGQRVLVTGAEGGFTLQSLPPGVYQISFTLDGFTPVTQSATVPLGGVAEQTITLRTAGVSENVQVNAETPCRSRRGNRRGLQARDEIEDCEPAGTQGIACSRPA